RRELPQADWVTIDHRPLPIIEAYSQAALRVWDVTPDFVIHSETVHRLSGFGAVATYQANGASPEGFDGEWRIVLLLTVQGDRIDRCEVFDESDLATALARFDELQPQARRLENAASRIIERYLAHFAARDWAAFAELLADDIVSDDRRRVVNAGIRRGRDVHIADSRVVVEVSAPTLSSNVIAARGERLALAHLRIVNRRMSGEVGADVLGIAEIDADERIVALVTFDPDNIDAAYAELDARYLAGEAAAYARTWSAIAGVYASFNRRELPAPDYVAVDHRRATLFTSGELAASIRDSLDLTPDLSIHIEAVHRLNNFGALLTNTSYGTSQEGFDAEWRMIQLLTVEGDSVKRLELFDETDLDAALARFEELQPQPPRLENAAGRIFARYFACFSARDWAAMAELLVDDIVIDDRRRVVNAGIRRGRDVYIADNQAAVEVGADTISSSVIATRGKRLALARVRSVNRGMSGEVGAEMLGLAEIDADERMVAGVIFDLEDIDAAFEELDARYLAGEGAVHAHAWSVIARTTDAFNRHEIPAADGVNIDNRTLAPVDASDLPAFIRDTWDLTPDFSTHIEAVHRLSSFGAVVTYIAYGTSLEGFAAEWRVVNLLAVEGDRISRVELFDEADIDTALARFDELERRTSSIENVATRAWARAADAFNRRDVDSFLALMTADGQFEDRRKGLRAVHKGAARRKAVRAVFEEAPASWRMHAEPIAIRGSRLELTRESYCDTDDVDQPIAVELLHVMELGDDDLMRDIVSFDPDDLYDAFAELTARWIASGEVAYPELIEAVDRINASINHHDWGTVATHFVGAEYVNHRQLGHAVNGTIDDWLSSLQTTGSLVPNFW
ncbi:MAG: hypothetical protein QOC79_1465, partial [Actinomycetota bacterium]|nr:hypothetical protein [Actinomycetota bacterium]